MGGSSLIEVISLVKTPVTYLNQCIKQGKVTGRPIAQENDVEVGGIQ